MYRWGKQAGWAALIILALAGCRTPATTSRSGVNKIEPAEVTQAPQAENRKLADGVVPAAWDANQVRAGGVCSH